MSGCIRCVKSELEAALKAAGDNRTEMEKVLAYFESKNDSLGLMAAKWTIENMPGHYGYDSTSTAGYYKAYHDFTDVSMAGTYVGDSIIQAFGTFDYTKGIVSDIRKLDSDFIIRDIEASIDARRKWPWAKNSDLTVYLQYVVPYRLGNETLHNGWRQQLQTQYARQLDSLANMKDSHSILYVANSISAMLDKNPLEWSSGLPAGPRTGTELFTVRYGDCQDIADRLIYMLRAAGIPAGCDRMILRGDGNSSHMWPFIIDETGRTLIWVDGCFRPVTERDFNFLKIYRDSFRHPDKYYTSDPFLIDVTDLYVKEGSENLEVPIDSICLKGTHSGEVWLCMARKQEWIPIHRGDPDRNKEVYSFGIVGSRCYAIICRVSDGKTIPISKPFITGNTGNPNFISPGHDTIIILYRKYTPSIGEYAQRMVGGVVEMADDINFTHGVDTILTIKEAPFRLYTVSDVPEKKPKRYIRYKGPAKSYCNIAEISFYAADSVQVKGRVIGARGGWGGDERRDIEAVFDGDPYTSYDYKEESGGWVGYEFNHPQTVSRIMYAPRNRDNFIREGDRYELFVWTDDVGEEVANWRSLGIKTAKSDSLVYTAPSGALYYLKNLTRGNDERIFTINSDTRHQIF